MKSMYVVAVITILASLIPAAAVACVPSPEAIKESFQKSDLNANGRLEYYEFLSQFGPDTFDEGSVGLLMEEFKRQDKNLDGFLGIEEFPAHDFLVIDGALVVSKRRGC